MAARIQVPQGARHGEIIEVRLLIQHPMETGFRYDALGRRTPRNAIRTLVCTCGGTEIFRATLSSGIAANPYLKFFTRARESGDIECRWVDQEGVAGSASARLTLSG